MHKTELDRFRRVWPRLQEVLDGEAEADTPGKELFVAIIEYFEAHDGALEVLEYAARYHDLRHGALVFRNTELPPSLSQFAREDLVALERATADHVVEQRQELESNYTELLGLLRDLSFVEPARLHPEERLLLELVSGVASRDVLEQVRFERVPETLFLAACGLARVLDRRDLRRGDELAETSRHSALTADTFLGGRDAHQRMSPYGR